MPASSIPMPSNFRLPENYKKHAITFLSFYGKEMLSTQENLFEAILKFKRRFVVDNHIDWFGLSGVPEHSNTAFVLGTIADKESSPLRLLLEGLLAKPKIRQNVFLFGMKSPVQEDILVGFRTPLLVISRLDEYASAVWDMSGIRKFDQPGGDKTKWNTSKSIADEKAKVLSLLSVNRIEEIDMMPDQQMKDEELCFSIERKKPECFKRFWESNDVSRFAYARLLLGRKRVSRKARKDFAISNYPNVFGDRDLIQNALFFNAGYASGDKAVEKMARFLESSP
jgi:hypothetical protein